jgi:hypothetical protein
MYYLCLKSGIFTGREVKKLVRFTPELSLIRTSRRPPMDNMALKSFTVQTFSARKFRTLLS